MKLLLASLLVLGAAGCAADASEEEELELSTSEVNASAQLKVVQFNPYYGGAYPKWAYSKPGGGHDGPRTYETAEAFSRLLAQNHPDAAVIGMQEIGNADVAEQMRIRLGDRWRTIFYGGVKETGSAIYWRDDLVALEKDLGKHAVNHFSAEHGGHAVMFGGALLSTRATGAKLAFFTGKFSPRTYDGAGDKEKDDEARSLTKWVGDVMNAHPKVTRVVAVDQNDAWGGLAFDELKKTWSQSGDQTATWKSPRSGDWVRYDYLWWDYDGGPKRSGGFVGASEVMGDSGSDHRAVISRVALAP